MTLPSFCQLQHLVDLEQLGVAGVDPLAQIVRSRQPGPTRAWAAAALGRLGTIAVPAVPSLEQGLTDKDGAVRYQCAWALMCLRESALPALARALSSDSTVAVLAALDAAGWLTEVAQPLTSRIKQHTKSADPNVSMAALSALIRVTGKTRFRIRTIASYLNHDDPEVRRTALEKLGELQDRADKYEGAIAERLTDEAPSVRQHAVLTLIKIGAVTSSLATLLDTIGDEDPDVRRALVIAFAHSEDVRSIAALQALTHDDKRGIARGAELALAGHPERDAA